MNKITIAEQMNNTQNNNNHNKQHPSAGRFFSIFSASAVTLLILFALNIFGILDFNNTNNAYAADSITLSISNSTLAINLFPDNTTGTFSKSSAANISVSTTSTSGYTLSIVGSNDTRNLVGSDTASGNNLSSIASSTTEATFSSNNESDYTTYNNKWGYMPSEYVNYVNDEPVRVTNTGANAVFLPGPTTAGDILRVTDCANGATGCSSGADTISLAIGARANSDMVKGTYANTFVIQAVTNTSVVECDDTKLCVQFDGNGLTFPETGSQFERVVNNVNYDSVTTSTPMTGYAHMSNVGDDGIATGDLSTISTNTAIDNTQTVTIAGAESLTVTLYYDTYSAYGYGYVSVYQSPFTISSSNDGSVSATTGNLSGRMYGYKSGRNTSYTTWNSTTYTVTGDTVKFRFYRSGTGTSYRTYYGYYAVVSGTSIIRNRTLTSGEYATPTGTNPYRFHGWSEDSSAISASSVTYTDEAAVKSRLSGDNGEVKTLYAVYDRGLTIKFNPASNSGTGTGTMNDQVIYTNDPQSLTANGFTAPSGMAFKEWNTSPDGSGTSFSNQATYTAPSTTSLGDTATLYAIWKQGYPIAFTKDSNVSSIDVVDDSGTTVGTISSSGQSLNLYQGNTYTLRPTYATGYTTNTITKTTGAGTITTNLPNADFTVGAGTATINVTSRTLVTFDQAFANAGKTKYNGYYKMQDANSTICSNVDLASLGNVGEVIDTRDGTVYHIGKLADNRCWMLDNLALDVVAKINNMNENNTNASNTTLGYLKNGGGSTTSGDATYKYASAGVANWTSSSSYSAPLVNISNKDIVPQGSDPMASTVLAGNWKVGGYYNFCAASAGSYCYGNGTKPGTTSGNATEDICPYGWRLPTGTSSGEFSALANAIYGSTSSAPDLTAYTNYRAALHLPLSGNFYNGSRRDQGTHGNWWSSTKDYLSSYMYGLDAGTGSLDPNASPAIALFIYRNYGYSLRCIIGS